MNYVKILKQRYIYKEEEMKNERFRVLVEKVKEEDWIRAKAKWGREVRPDCQKLLLKKERKMERKKERKKEIVCLTGLTR